MQLLCRSGGYATGVSWGLFGDDLFVTEQNPVAGEDHLIAATGDNPDGWDIAVQNRGTGVREFTAYLVCTVPAAASRRRGDPTPSVGTRVKSQLRVSG